MRSEYRFIAGTLMASFAGVGALGQNTGVRLTAGDATYDYAFGGLLPAVSNGPSGVVPTNFQLNGLPGAGANWMSTLNWFYRIQGDTRERHLSGTAGQITQIPTGTNEIEYRFSTVYSGGAANTPVPNVSAHMHFRVMDTGVDRARLTTQVCFENTGASPIVVDTFCVADLDLLGTALGDIYQPLSITGNDYMWTANDGIGTGVMLGRSAIGAGVGDFATIMGQMTDTGSDNFTTYVNPGGISGASDNYALIQFQAFVPPGTTICIPLDIDIEIVPEPTSVLLLVAGIAAALRRRRAVV